MRFMLKLSLLAILLATSTSVAGNLQKLEFGGTEADLSACANGYLYARDTGAGNSQCIDPSTITPDTATSALTSTNADNLTLDPTDCLSNQFAVGADRQADLTCAAITDADVPNDITIELAAAASALAVNPIPCGAGNYVSDLDADGTLICGTPAGGGGGTVTDVTGTAPISSSGGATPAISIIPATVSVPGSMSAADKTKLDGIAALATVDQTITLTGDVTGSGTGSFNTTLAADTVEATNIVVGGVGTSEIADGTVAMADLANLAPLSVIGRSTTPTGVPAAITATGTTGYVLREAAGTIGFGRISPYAIDDAADDPTIGECLKASVSDPLNTFEWSSCGVPSVASTDNRIARFDGSSGAIQDSVVGISDAGDIDITSDHSDIGEIGCLKYETPAGTGGGRLNVCSPTVSWGHSSAVTMTLFDGGVLPTAGDVYFAVVDQIDSTNTALNWSGASGDVSGPANNLQIQANAVTTAEIQDGQVALTDMADMATSSLIYRRTALTGVPQVNTLATLKTDLLLTGTNSGDQDSVTGNAGTATALAVNPAPCSAGNYVSDLDADGTLTCGTPAGGGGGYGTVEEEGTPVTQRTNLNFIGGAMTCADDAVDTTNCTLAITDADVPNDITIELAAAASALAVNPAPCSAGNYVSDLDADGTLICGTPAGGGGGYDTVEEEGVGVTQRTNLNFIGSSITCVDDAVDTTNCTVTGVAAVASTDNRIARFDGSSGDIQNSVVGISDAGDISITSDHSDIGEIGCLKYETPAGTGSGRLNMCSPTASWGHNNAVTMTLFESGVLPTFGDSYFAVLDQIDSSNTALNWAGADGDVSGPANNLQIQANAVTTAEIQDGQVALADMANMPTSSLIYRRDALTGVPQVTTLATLKADLLLTGTNSGDQSSVTGNAGTATALAVDPTACSAGDYVSDLDADGTLTCGTPAGGGGGGALFAWTNGGAVMSLTSTAQVTAVEHASVTASTEYIIEGMLMTSQTASGANLDVAVGWQYPPTDARMAYTSSCDGGNTDAGTTVTNYGEVRVDQSANFCVVRIHGRATSSIYGGFVRLTIGQNSANGTTTVQGDSWFKITPVP